MSNVFKINACNNCSHYRKWDKIQEQPTCDKNKTKVRAIVMRQRNSICGPFGKNFNSKEFLIFPN